jgi:hypothetical protein
VTPQRLDALRKWAAGVKPSPATRAATQPAPLSGSSLAAARQDIDAALSAPSPEDARAVRERLARYGEALLPEVYAQLAAAATDDQRQRLRAIRYRLVASDRLALAYPQVIERLSAVDPSTRLSALDELAAEATPADQRLLLELFADPDALFREKSLKLLQSVGGADASAPLA